MDNISELFESIVILLRACASIFIGLSLGVASRTSITDLYISHRNRNRNRKDPDYKATEELLGLRPKYLTPFNILFIVIISATLAIYFKNIDENAIIDETTPYMLLFGTVGLVFGMIFGKLFRMDSWASGMRTSVRGTTRRKPSLSTVVASHVSSRRFSGGLFLLGISLFLFLADVGLLNVMVAVLVGFLGITSVLDAVLVLILNHRREYGQSALEVRELAGFLVRNQSGAGQGGGGRRQPRLYESEGLGIRGASADDVADSPVVR